MSDGMRGDASSPQLGQHVLQEAAEWFVLLASGEADDGDRARWQQWHEADAAHARAWAKVQAASAPFGAVPRARTSAAVQVLTQKNGARRRSLAVVALIGLLGIAGWQGYRASDRSADALTLAGQQRELHLDDGSRLLLDTDTALDIDFDSRARTIRIRRGRILVETGHAAAYRDRPFIVVTSDGSFTALGTEFTIEQQRDATRIAVIEARVAAHPIGDAHDIIVAAGQSALFGRNVAMQPVPLARNDVAWVGGILIADAMPLAEFVAALGRYRSDTLVCDPSAAHLRISGSFPLRDTDRVLAALAQTLPLYIDRAAPGIVRLQRKDR